MDLLVHLETFVAVADQRSFSRAAEQLRIAQPLLSRRVKNLEAALGGELFHRTPRQIRLSDFGDLLVPYARDVLDRTSHLRSVAEAARNSTARVLGIPPGCEPSALARVIRAAADRGIPLRVHEAPAAARAKALLEGALALALVRVPADAAPMVVAMGLASATPLSQTGGRSLHLDSLRPRRSDHVGEPPALLVVPEDDIPLFTDRLHRAMATAGLAHERVRVTSSSAAAAAEVLAGAGLLLCDGRSARRHGLPWTPLADAGLHRGYELAAAARGDGATAAGEVTDWLAPLLGAAVGAAARGEPSGDDPRARLAARA